MIEIKHKINGKVLYTAENANDVRGAVEEAVKAKANLRSADLRSANLGSADLRSADLGYADLGWHHPLWIFQQDFFSILDQAPAEVAGLRATMVDGKIDGSTYEGPCSCLAGTIAAVHGCSVDALDDELGIKTDASRPAEQWFICTQQGEKPIPVEEGTEFETESVFRISVALVWLDKWIESRKAVAAILEPAE